MTGKQFAKISILMTVILLLLVASFQVVIDPLFQYHQPWFALKPIITDERYQNAGIAKTFNYENAIIGNSISENFYISDVEETFKGKTVKLTAYGSHTIDWRYTLNILKNKNPNNILFNLDPYIMEADPDNLNHDLPGYLYDQNYLNDVNYWFNFSILEKYTCGMLKNNQKNIIPDYNTIYAWNDEYKTGKEETLKNYSRPEKTTEHLDYDELKRKAIANLDNLSEYYRIMPDTQFVFFCSPFCILFWDKENQSNSIPIWREVYLNVIQEMMQYDNVSVFFWTDQEMLDLICNLDNYRDEAHFSADVCKNICKRISLNDGLLNQSNYELAINTFFDFLSSYDYDSIFA